MFPSVDKLGNIFVRNIILIEKQYFSCWKLVGKCMRLTCEEAFSWEANFVSATMFREVETQENIDRKHDVSAILECFLVC